MGFVIGSETQDRGAEPTGNITTTGRNLFGCRSVYSYCIPIGAALSFVWDTNMTQIEKNPVWQGTLSLMVLRTLLTMGEQHGYGIARRIEQTSDGKLSINYGTLYPALLKLEQEGLISAQWGVSDNNRKAKFYRLTKAGRKQIERDTREWEAMSAIMTRFLAANED